MVKDLPLATVRAIRNHEARTTPGMATTRGGGRSMVTNDNPPKTCQWPLWGADEPVNRDFCGESVVPGRSYCTPHLKRAIRKPRKSEE